MSRSPVAFVSSLADRCGLRPPAGTNLANVNHAVSNGGLHSQLKEAAFVHGDKVALKCLNRNLVYSYNEFLADSNKVAALLTSMMVPERSVCIFLSRPSFSLVTSYMGAVAANCVPAIVHEDVADSDLIHICNDSQAKVVFVASQPLSSRNQQHFSDKFVQSILPKLYHCQHVVLLPPDSLSDAGVLQKLQAEANLLASKFNSKSVAPGDERRTCQFMSWTDAMAIDYGSYRIELETRSNNVHADSCCCVCYGSSTSRSRPIGSMLSHDNILWSGRVFSENYLLLEAGSIVVVTLPMAFALSQVIYIAAALQAGATVCFPPAPKTPHDVSLSTIVQAQPHFIICTPLQWKSLIAEMGSLPTVARASPQSQELGLLGGRAAALGQSKPRFYGWNRARIFSKIWAACGLVRCKFLGSYGDSCPQHIIERLMTMGLCLCNVYGCNEATGIIASTKNDPLRPQLPLANNWKFGCVGRCIPGCEVRLVVDKQQPGKVLFLGRNTFMGYLNHATPCNVDGFIDTGDWGSVNESMIDIAGRDTDRIVLKSGAAVHAAAVQTAIEQGIPGAARTILMGHGLPHMSVFCEFAQDANSKGSLSEACIAWQREKLVDPRLVQVTTAGALGSESFMRQVAVALHEMQMAGKLKEAHIAKITFTQESLSVEDEDLIPGGRLACRRDRILKRFMKQIGKMYAQVPLEELASSLDSVFSNNRVADGAATPNVDGQLTSPPKDANTNPVSQLHSADVSASTNQLHAGNAVNAVSPAHADSPVPLQARDDAAYSESVVPPTVQESKVVSSVGTNVDSEPLSPAAAGASVALAPPGTICELPDGTRIDLAAVEQRLVDASPILLRAVVYHLPGQTFFVSLLSLRTQSWQSVPPNIGGAHAATLPHHLLHEDVVTAIAARGSSAMTTMEAKSDKIIRAMLTDALKKVNESAPRDANGKKQGAVLKYVIVPTGLGVCQDEQLPDGYLNRARVIEKFRNSINQMYGTSIAAVTASVSPSIAPASRDGPSASQAQTALSHGDHPPPSPPTIEEVASSSSAVSYSGSTARTTQAIAPSLSAAIDPSVPPTSSKEPAAPLVDTASDEKVHATPRQCGIGVYLRQAQEGFIEVKATEPHCSADNLLFEGDIVSAVDGAACIGLSLRDITRLIVGEEGSCVTVTVMRQTPISLYSSKTIMKEIPVLLTRRPLPQQRSSRAIKALSESRLQTPRGDLSDRLQEPASTRQSNALLPPAALVRANSLPELPGDSGVLDPAQSSKLDGIMRQFLVSNTGYLPLKLSVYDQDDVMRVSEVVIPFSKYPVEENTFLPLPSGQRVRVVLQSGMSEFYLQLGPYDKFLNCFLCAEVGATGIQVTPLEANGRMIDGNLNARQLHSNSANS